MRILRGVVIGFVGIVVVLAVLAGVLAATSPGPRESPGWERLADMPDPRGETAMTTAVTQDPGCPPEDECPVTYTVVVAGGLGGLGGSRDTVSLYDPDTDTWTEGPALPGPRDHAAAAAIGDVVYVTGGSERIGRGAQPNLWALRPGATQWEQLPDMPEGRWGHAMAALDGRLFVVGGAGPSADLLVFDPQAQEWSRGPAMPVQRDHLGAVAWDGRIWAIGGRAGGNLQDRVDLYDPVQGAWESGPTLPEPMSAMAFGVLPSGLHVVGGEDPGLLGGVIDSHYRLPAPDSDWQEASLPVNAVHGVHGAVAGDQLLIASGSRRQGGLSVLGWTGITQAYDAG